nr:pif-4 [Darna trima granulovirus]
MSSTDIFTAFLLITTLIILLISTLYNPLIFVGKKIADSARVGFGSHIKIFQNNDERLFVIEPDHIVLYNNKGVLYYYFEGGASRRFCPFREYAIMRLSYSDIGLINETGTYNITCTKTSSLTMQNYFESMSVNQYYVEGFNSNYTIIDVINFLISKGLAYIEDKDNITYNLL